MSWSGWGEPVYPLPRRGICPKGVAYQLRPAHDTLLGRLSTPLQVLTLGAGTPEGKMRVPDRTRSDRPLTSPTPEEGQQVTFPQLRPTHFSVHPCPCLLCPAGPGLSSDVSSRLCLPLAHSESFLYLSSPDSQRSASTTSHILCSSAGPPTHRCPTLWPR